MILTRRHLIELSYAIRERRSALLDEIARGVAQARADSHEALAGDAPDRAEEALADVVADLDLAEVTRDFGELEELEAAVRRLADGSYGVCVDCGADIPVERLRARPGAPRCLDCQGHHEKALWAVSSREAILDEAEVELKGSGVRYTREVLTGPIGQTICAHGERLGCDAIVMGRHGKSALGDLLMGRSP